MEFSGGVFPSYASSDFRISGSAAIRAGDIHIRKKLNVKAYHTCTITGRTSQFSCVIGKVTILVAVLLRVRSLGKHFPEFIMYIGISRYGGTDIDTYRRSIDKFDLTDSVSFDRLHMRRQIMSRDFCLKSGNEAFQHHGGLAGTGDSSDHSKPSFWNLHAERMNCVNSICSHRYLPFIEHIGSLYLLSYFNRSFARKEWADLRFFIDLNVIDSTLRHYFSTV